MEDFSTLLENWYARNGRWELPWRKVSDPYLIWLSETILQQTRVVQGYDYYLRFAERFPDVFALAAADEDEVLKLWQGLGYYSRARNLHAAAKTVAESGKFPDTYEDIRKLKGVGDYTAAAIASFAFQLPHAVVDGNVYRVLSRFFGITTPIDSVQGKKEFTALANELLDREHPARYNSAIMDFGALQCTPKSPACHDCPLAGGCHAYQKNQVASLPVKAKKVAVTHRYFVYLYMEDEKQLLLHRREGKDIWKGLYEPLLIEFPHAPEDKEVMEAIHRLPGCAETNITPIAKGIKHVLTHQKLQIDGYRLSLPQLPNISGCILINKEERYAYAVPKVVNLLFDLIDQAGD